MNLMTIYEELVAWFEALIQGLIQFWTEALGL